MFSILFGCLFFVTACGGGGGSSLTGAPAQAASPSPHPSASPAAAASAAPASSPQPGPTAVAASACLQTQAPAPLTVAVVPFTTFTSKLSSAHTICFSAYVFTSASFSALDAAAKSGADETVVLPLEEESVDSSDANQLAADGAHVIIDPGMTAAHPLHAKLAIVDGSAFLDGRNWDTSDVVVSDTNPADFAAIENALNLNPTSSANLDTLKSIALSREAQLITSAAPGSGVTVRFMTESFSSGAANVISALEAAAQNGANVEVVVLASDLSGNTLESATLTTMKNPPFNISIRTNPADGSEKMTLIDGQSTGWFGSANATSSSSDADNYIDWGMTVNDPTVLSSLQSYFDSVYASSTPF